MKKVFIDCGARRCDVTRIFLEQGLTDWDYYLFEPSPKLNGYFKKLVEDYPQVNFDYSKKAVWIEEGEIDFYYSRRGNSGSTILKEKFSNKVDHDNPVKVETIDFSSWVKDNINKDDYIILKVDIEGAEYEVLNKMVEDGTLDYADELIVEFHGESKMHRTQRHHDVYAIIAKYLTDRDFPVYSDNERKNRVFEK